MRYDSAAGREMGFVKEDQVSLLGDIAAAPGGAGHIPPQLFEGTDMGGTGGGEREDIFGDLGLIGTPGDKHITPVTVGKTVPLAVFGVFV